MMFASQMMCACGTLKTQTSHHIVYNTSFQALAKYNRNIKSREIHGLFLYIWIVAYAQNIISRYVVKFRKFY